jgi:hypothetical protein
MFPEENRTNLAPTQFLTALQRLAETGHMAAKKSARKVLIYSGVIAGALGMVFVILLSTGGISGDSDTEELMFIPNLSGMEFTVIYASRARLFVTDYAISIYARGAATKEESLLAKWSNRRTLLFRYDLGRMRSTLLPEKIF